VAGPSPVAAADEVAAAMAAAAALDPSWLGSVPDPGPGLLLLVAIALAVLGALSGPETRRPDRV
jgi:hypothetical protein